LAGRTASNSSQNCLGSNLSNSKVQTCLNATSSSATKASNIGVIVFGGLAVFLLLFGSPIWIIFLVKAGNYNKKLKSTSLSLSQDQYTPQTPQINNYQNNNSSSQYPQQNSRPVQAQDDTDNRPPTNNTPIV